VASTGPAEVEMAADSMRGVFTVTVEITGPPGAVSTARPPTISNLTAYRCNTRRASVSVRARTLTLTE
jgi:hypothetical protein